MVDPLVEGIMLRRRERGISQTDVAEAMGTTQSHVSELESGLLDPRLSTLRKYAEVVGVDLLGMQRETSD